MNKQAPNKNLPPKKSNTGGKDKTAAKATPVQKKEGDGKKIALPLIPLAKAGIKTPKG